MDTALFNASLVVLAESNNPTILNPDFLRIQRVVPEEWGWELGGAPITTPPFSRVSYSSGYSITVEENKIQFSQDGASIDLSDSRLTEIATKYLEVLPHVQYRAIGTNFRVASKEGNPEEFLIEKFIKPGRWNSGDHHLSAAAVKLVYQHDEARLTISLDPGTSTSPKEANPSKAIICHANIHRDLIRDADLVEQLIVNLNKFSDDFARFNSLYKEIV